jgi:hypothetical protein
MLEWYRAMRASPLIVLLLAGLACRRGALQPEGPDSGGGVGLSLDAAGAGDLATGGGDGGSAGGGPGASDAAAPTPDANCGYMTRSFSYVVPQILIVLDHGVTGPVDVWRDVLRALNNVVVQNGPRIDWGLYSFPGPGIACGSGTLTSAVDIPVTSMDSAAVAAGISAARLDGSGAATAAAIAIGANHLRTLPIDRPSFLLLVTDHAPTCAGTTIGALSYAPDQAQNDALDEISAAAHDGFKTIVLAPSTAPDVDHLNDLAQVGGQTRAPSGQRYYTEFTLSDLFTSMAATCTFPLESAPLTPDNVAVALNGTAVPRDTSHTNGWDYTAPNNVDITLYGDWCTRVVNGPSVQLTVLYGCP